MTTVTLTLTWVPLALALAGPAEVITTDDAQADAPRTKRIRRICRVTAYCDRGTTASGVESGVGQCAAPIDIPFGAQVHVPELGRTLTVTDRTARRFRRNTVDIFIPTRAACLRFGRKYLLCEFTVPLE